MLAETALVCAMAFAMTVFSEAERTPSLAFSPGFELAFFPISTGCATAAHQGNLAYPLIQTVLPHLN